MASYCYSIIEPKEKPDTFIQLPRFGAAEWKKFLQQEVIEPEVPSVFQDALKANSSIHETKPLENTDMLLLIPPNLSLDDLLSMLHPDHISSFHTQDTEPSQENPYWILLTRTPIPDSYGKEFEDQQKLAKKYGYSIPYAIEVAVGMVAAKFLGDLQLYEYGEAEIKCCDPSKENFPFHVRVSSGPDNTINISRYLGYPAAVAGVRRN